MTGISFPSLCLFLFFAMARGQLNVDSEQGEVRIGHREAPPLPQPPPRIAIVGAGIGGTSCAHFLRQLFEDPEVGPDVANITVFELGAVGGRLATVEMAGHAYEIGGTVIHPQNQLVKDLVETVGLRERYQPTYVGSWQQNRYSMHSFFNLTYVSWRSTILEYVHFLWHYGIWDVMKLSNFISDMLYNFSFAYPFLKSGHSVDTTSDLLNVMLPPAVGTGEQRQVPRKRSLLFNDTTVSLQRKLKDEGISDLLINQLGRAAVGTNYGQTPSSVHSFVGSVALAGIDKGLWSIENGNKRLPQLLLEKSGANFVQAQVNGVALNDEGRYFFTFNRLSAASDEPQGLFREGKNEGKPSRVQTETNEEEEEFDIVVLALPMTKDKTTLEITGLPEKPVFPGRYHRTVATLVHGVPNPNAFGFETLAEMTANNFFTDVPSNIQSFAIQVPVDVTPATEASDLPLVWKVFSHTPLTLSDINELFSSVEKVVEADWLAYPHYEWPQPLDHARFELHKGLYHVNAIEWASSAIEMSAMGAKNVANAAHAFWVDKQGRIKADLSTKETSAKTEL